MNPNEKTLINLYIGLQVAKYKAAVFKEKNCEVPAILETHIRNLEAQIIECERKAA